MHTDSIRVREYNANDLAHHDGVRWRAFLKVEKFAGDYRPGMRPYEVVEREGNLLMTQGATDLWNNLTGQASPTQYVNATCCLGVGDGNPTAGSGTVSVTNGSTSVTFSTSQSGLTGNYITITGDSTGGVYKVASGSGTSWTLASGYGGSTNAAASWSQITGEVASQTDLQATTNKLRKAMQATYPSVSGNQVTFQSLFATTDANFSWSEWGVFSASSAGHLLNRKVVGLGLKTSAASWTMTATLSLS